MKTKKSYVLGLAILTILLCGRTAIAINPVALYVNGEIVRSDVPAQIIEGTTMVPLRVIAEKLGAQVNWDGAASTVSVVQKSPLDTAGTDNVVLKLRLVGKIIDNYSAIQIVADKTMDLSDYLYRGYAEMALHDGNVKLNDARRRITEVEGMIKTQNDYNQLLMVDAAQAGFNVTEMDNCVRKLKVSITGFRQAADSLEDYHVRSSSNEFAYYSTEDQSAFNNASDVYKTAAEEYNKYYQILQGNQGY